MALHLILFLSLSFSFSDDSFELKWSRSSGSKERWERVRRRRGERPFAGDGWELAGEQEELGKEIQDRSGRRTKRISPPHREAHQ